MSELMFDHGLILFVKSLKDNESRLHMFFSIFLISKLVLTLYVVKMCLQVFLKIDLCIVHRLNSIFSVYMSKEKEKGARICMQKRKKIKI